MEFIYQKDKEFFRLLLCQNKEKLEDYSFLFDFREPKTKRKEFNKIKSKVLNALVNKFGKNCMLGYDKICNPKSGFVLDHLIPLSSNKLNKELRKMEPLKGKKVLTQSFGSNNIENLVIACKKCNSYKKHKFEKEMIQRILKFKF